MARLARRYSSSDDELPELDTLLRKPARTARGSGPANKSPAKTLVPKATTTSSTRRVRRLGEPEQVKSNPLFQKWDSTSKEEDTVPESKVKSRQPTVKVRELRKQSAKITPSQQPEGEDEGPQRQVSANHRRPRIVDELEEESDGDSGSGDETLFTRIRRLQSAKSRDTKAFSDGRRSGSQETAIDEPLRPREQRHRQKTPVYESESESAEEQQISEAEDPSLYLTAEESSGYSDGAASDEDTPGRPKRSLPSKLLFDRPQEAIGAKRSISPIKNAPPLRPRNISSNNSSALSSRSSTQESIPTKRNTGSRKTSYTLNKDASLRKTETKSTASELAETFSKLRLQLEEFSEDEKPSKQNRFTTPPSTPPKTKPAGLISPSKRIQIPKTPHRPSMDAFWSQDVVDDWNQQHSPRKLILPPVTKSPTKTSPKKETKKAFAARRHAIAEDFLRELDQEITQGRIAKLAESTGGVKIVWTKTLNTTAGRANWRRETIRTKQADGTQLSVTYKHHASIELAEKVIDDEHRLLNVLAHEFCHLANFMISSITTNPHGKEFKAWASQCSHAFADRGIHVTTKHTYEIDFKYIWECVACHAEYKRHSKSIDPQRHRCGTCKSELKQTKPVPRNGGGKVSKYQTFVKEQMKVVREENPGSPQKDVMRLIADKWAKQGGGSKKGGVDAVVSQMVDLTLEE